MADKYERWNKWAPRVIADLMDDFDLTDEQAAAFVGNFAAESAYFNDIVEDGALAKGWAGGTGFAQWTAARRNHPVWGFEAWIKRKGWAADSYEGNYSYLYRELSGASPRSISGLRADLIPLIKSSTSLENATWRVAAYFEKPKVINLAPRVRAAKEALALYRKNPAKPTVWPTDKKDRTDMPTPAPIPVAPPAGVAPPVMTTVPDTSRPAVPWFKSLVFTGVSGGLGSVIYALAQAYKPGVPFLDQIDTLWPLITAVIGTGVALLGRVTSTAQPLTTSQAAADKIAEAKTVAVATVAAGNVQVGANSVRPVHEAWAPPPLSAEERAAGWQTVQPQRVPMTELSLDQLSAEMPVVAEKVAGVVAAVLPMLGTIGKFAELGKALHDSVKKD
jgi:hypothetical protein